MKRHVKRHTVCQPLDPSYRLIPLTQGQNAIVDATDYEWLSKWNWRAQWDAEVKSYYAVRASRNTTALGMHRQILDCGPSDNVDHENHDTLDNRRNNLRKATDSQNKSNGRLRIDSTSGFKGVTWRKKEGRWRVRIGFNRKRIHLGDFTSAEEAARTYDEAAKKFHGEFAHLNFP